MPTVFELTEKESRIKDIEKEQSKQGFWSDQQKAAELSRELSELIEEVEFIDGLRSRLIEVKEYYDLLNTYESDVKTKQAFIDDVNRLEEQIKKKEKELRFDGSHDKANAIITVQAGAGGTDAQDWAEILERMYLRFAENNNWNTVIIDRSPGEEAGIKSSTFMMEGKYAYGYLREEHGVHRLVRLSPFNADNLRHTSFARVEVLPEIPPKESVEIDQGDLEVDTFRASGAGGQHVNKTSSAVRIKHVPSGIVVQCQSQRSQAQNKTRALSVLLAKLQKTAEVQHVEKLNEVKGESKDAAWGNQIRSYVMHPYTMVKDHRTKKEEVNIGKVLDGDLSGFLEA